MKMPMNPQKPYQTKHEEKMQLALSSPDELCCPVCQRSLALSPSLRSSGIVGDGKQETAMRNEIKKMCAGKLKEETVVSAMCGHIFHRFCLRHYCYTYRQSGPTEGEKVECPVCFQYISMIKVHTIDYKGHQKLASNYEKTLRREKRLFKELEVQKQTALTKLESIKNQIDEGRQKIHFYRAHERSVKDETTFILNAIDEKEKLFKIIEGSNRRINLTHKENIQLIRMYLNVMKSKPEEFLREKCVPSVLIPYLSVISDDERLMQKFGEILKPVEIDGLRSNTGMLIREILADVKPMADEKQKRIEIVKSKLHNQFKLKGDTESPVVVKVEYNSDLSVFSRGNLNVNSIQDIIQQVKSPVETIKIAHKNAEKASKFALRKSQSEIKILFQSKKRNFCESGSAPVTLEFGDALFIGKHLVPARKCKSTDPILISTFALKGRRAIAIKPDDIDQNETLVGDTLNNHAIENDISNDPSGVKVLQATHSTQTAIPDETVSIYKNINSSEYLKSHNSKDHHYHYRQSEHQGNFDKVQSRGFETRATGSVFEMIFDTMDKEDKSAMSLVDDVFRVTLRKDKEPKLDLYEYKVDSDGRIKQPIVQDNILYGRVNQTDIEGGIKISELVHPKRNLNHTQKFVLEEQKSHGLIKGILPGPYSNLERSPRPNASEYSKMGGTTNGRKQLPFYLSNWLNKLPSAKTTYRGLQNADPLLPPPPIQCGPNRIIISSRNEQLLPPLPITPPPPPLINNKRLSNVQERLFYENFARNRPYGDDTVEVSYYKKDFSDPNASHNHTVIDVPGSNSNVNRFRLPPFNNSFNESIRRSPPCTAWRKQRGNNNTRPEEFLRCNNILPPLPEEETTRRQRQLLSNVPTYNSSSCKSQSGLTLSQIPLQSSFSNENTSRPRISGWTNTCSNRINPVEPFHNVQFGSSINSNSNTYDSNEAQAFRRDLNSTEGCMLQNNYLSIPCYALNLHDNNNGSTNANVEKTFSEICERLSPPCTPAFLQEEYEIPYNTRTQRVIRRARRKCNYDV